MGRKKKEDAIENMPLFDTKKRIERYRIKYDLNGMITNKTFGRLTATGETRTNRLEKIEWQFKCSCGKILWLTKPELRKLMDPYPYIQANCGCFTQYYLNKRIKEVCGTTKDRLYYVYNDMFKRTIDPTNWLYIREHDVEICKQWKDPGVGYHNFVRWSYRHGGYIEQDLKETPESELLTIVRKDLTKPYQPDNCFYNVVTFYKKSLIDEPDHHVFFNGIVFSMDDLIDILGFNRDDLDYLIENELPLDMLAHNFFYPEQKVIIQGEQAGYTKDGYQPLIRKYQIKQIDQRKETREDKFLPCNSILSFLL